MGNGFGDFQVSLKMRDVMEKLTKAVIDRERPRYRYATVDSIDAANFKCNVVFQGETIPVTVTMGSIQPTAVGQVVRVGGIGSDKFIEDVMGQAGGSGGGTITGESKIWNGPDLPDGFLWEDGAAYSRTTESALFEALTRVTTVTTTTGSNRLSGMSAAGVARLYNGLKVEGTGIPANATITAVGANYVDLSANATASASISARIFFHGNGDGSTTFNVPDKRVRELIGAGTGKGIGATDALAETSRNAGHDHGHGHAKSGGVSGATTGVSTQGVGTGVTTQGAYTGIWAGGVPGIDINHTHNVSLNDPGMPVATTTTTTGSGRRITGGENHAHGGTLGSGWMNQNNVHGHNAPGIGDPTHSHPISDPGHSHPISDPSHTHPDTIGVATNSAPLASGTALHPHAVVHYIIKK